MGELPDGLRVVLPRALESATRARHAVAEVLAAWGLDDLSEAALTVVTELVTNAVLHASSEVTVEVRPGPGCVRVEVSDASVKHLPTLPPEAHASAPADDGGEGGEFDTVLATLTTGRGLRLVERLSARWGVAVGDGSKTVWADIGPGEPPPAWPALVTGTDADRARRVRIGDGERREVVVQGVPVRLATANDDHLDELVRELQLVILGGGTSTVPREVVDRVALLLTQFDGARHDLREVARAATEDGLDRFDLVVELRPEVVDGLRLVIEQLDLLNEWARRGQLLAPLASPELSAFRHWLVNEIARQLSGQPPSPCPFDVGAGPDWAAGPSADDRLAGARLRSLIEAGQLDVWRANARGDLVSDMPAWRGVTGQEGGDLLGDGWLDGVHPDHRGRVYATWKRAVASGSTLICEYPIVRPDGSVRHIVARAVPVKDGETVREWVGTTVDVTDQKRAEEQRDEQARLVATLHEVGMALTSTLDLEELMARLTSSTTEMTGAAFGAFFFNAEGPNGEAFQLYTLHGAPRSAFADFPMPRNTGVFAPTFAGERVVRHDDVTAAPAYGHNPPYSGMPEGHLPVRSYLAVPVVSRTGRVHGGLFFGHAEPGRFTARHEEMVAAVARQAAIGIDNAMLFERQRAVAGVLQRALLPQAHPPVAGLDYAIRYLPGAAGSEVGGDWYDVSVEAGVDPVVAIGDVQGKGVQAAGFMGQVRAAVRAYALAGVPPAGALQLLSRFWAHQPDMLSTCLYMRVGDGAAALEVASAGHLPPLVVRGGQVAYADLAPGPPLGVGDAEYSAVTVELGPGDGFVVFTDGLVERRDRPVPEGLARVAEVAAEVAGSGSWTAEALADALVAALAGDDADDDVALIVARRSPT